MSANTRTESRAQLLARLRQREQEAAALRAQLGPEDFEPYEVFPRHAVVPDAAETFVVDAL